MIVNAGPIRERRLGRVLVAALVVAAAGLPGSAQALEWDPPTVSLSAAGGTVTSPQIAMSGDGSRAIAIWHRKVGVTRVIQTAVATITGTTVTWGATTDLATVDSNGAPRVALSWDGARATAAWLTGNGAATTVQSKSAAIAGTTATWGATATDLATAASGQSVNQMRLGLSRDGTHATVVWTQLAGAYLAVRSKSGVIDGTGADWTGSVASVSPNDEEAWLPQLALSEDGSRAVAVWIKDVIGSTSDFVRTAAVDITGTSQTWTGVTNLSTDAVKEDPQVAVSEGGATATAVWIANNGSLRFTQSRSAVRTDSGWDWSQASDLSAVTQQASQPQVRLSGAGDRAIAMWRQFDGTDYVVQTASSTLVGNTATWGTNTVLTGAGQYGVSPQVELSRDGRRATAVWAAYNGSNYLMQSRSAMISGTASTWGSVTDLSTGGHSVDSPRVGVSGDGTRAIAAWVLTDGVDTIVQTTSAHILAQGITFPAIADVRLDKGPVTVTAYASSGSPVSFTASTPGTCTVSGSTVTLVAAGTCTLVASQPGDPDHAAAADVTRSFTITPTPAPDPTPTGQPGPTPTVTVTPQTPPGPVTGLRASSKAGKVRLRWAAPAAAVTGYAIDASANLKRWRPVATTAAGVTTYSWTKAKKGRTYYLRVAATSAIGRGTWAIPVMVKVR